MGGVGVELFTPWRAQRCRERDGFAIMDHVPFADELRQLLPADLPFREECIAGAARHLELIVEANQIGRAHV